VNWATSAAGPPVKRPLRETGKCFFMGFKREECASVRSKSHCETQLAGCDWAAKLAGCCEGGRTVAGSES